MKNKRFLLLVNYVMIFSMLTSCSIAVDNSSNLLSTDTMRSEKGNEYATSINVEETEKPEKLSSSGLPLSTSTPFVITVTFKTIPLPEIPSDAILIRNPTDKFIAATYCEEICKIVIIQSDNSAALELQFNTIFTYRPYSNLVWIDNEILTFDQWVQPHYAWHYEVNIVTEHLINAFPFPDVYPTTESTGTSVIKTPEKPSPSTPKMMQSGSVALAIDKEYLLKNISQKFDFDENRIVNTRDHEDDVDISFDYGVQSNDIFMFFSPSLNAQGVIINSIVATDPQTTFSFDISDCENPILQYQRGIIPIQNVGSVFCWKTSKGNIAEFFVESIETLSIDEGLYRIVIKFVTWRKE